MKRDGKHITVETRFITHGTYLRHGRTGIFLDAQGQPADFCTSYNDGTLRLRRNEQRTSHYDVECDTCHTVYSLTIGIPAHEERIQIFKQQIVDAVHDKYKEFQSADGTSVDVSGLIRNLSREFVVRTYEIGDYVRAAISQLKLSSELSGWEK